MVFWPSRMVVFFFVIFQTLAALTGILESVAERRKSCATDASTSSSSGGASTPPPSPSQNTDNEDSNHGEEEQRIFGQGGQISLVGYLYGNYGGLGLQFYSG